MVDDLENYRGVLKRNVNPWLTKYALAHIVVIGAVKGRRSSAEEFSEDEIGKVISFLTDLLRLRPDRAATERMQITISHSTLLRLRRLLN